MFWNLLWIENQKNLRRKLLWIELGLLAVFVIFVFAGLYVAYQSSSDSGTITETDRATIPVLISWPGSLVFSLRFAAGSKLLLIIFVGAVTASEYTWRTYSLWLSHGIPRTTLLVSKFISFLLPLFLVVTCAFLTGALITILFSLKINGSLILDQISFWHLGFDLFRTAYTLLPYVGMTFFLAVVTRSAVAAIGGCVGYGLIVESLLGQYLMILPGKLGTFAKILPANLMQSVLDASWTPSAMVKDFNPGLLAPFPAAMGIAVWTALFMAFAILLFNHQDLSG